MKNRVALEVLNMKIVLEVHRLGYDPRLLTAESLEQEEFSY